MKPARVVIDFETRSRVDLRKTSADVYARDMSTLALCLAYKIDKAPVRLWLPGDLLIPDDLEEAITGGALVWAHNVTFERMVWRWIMVNRYHWPAIKFENWRCSMAMCAFHGLPRSLDQAAQALGLQHTKDMTGHRVMMKLARPRKPTKNNPAEWHSKPDDFDRLYEYCKKDVKAEAALIDSLEWLPPLEQKIWQLDQRINDRGVYCDRETVEAILSVIDEMAEDACEELKELTGGEVETPNQRDRILDFCESQGIDLPSLDKTIVARALEKKKLPDNVRRVLEIRQLMGKASVRKYQAILDRISPDNRVRSTVIYCGAGRTGRWSGSGFQTQNIARGFFKPKTAQQEIEYCIGKIHSGSIDLIDIIYDDRLAVFSSLVRSVIMGEPGFRLACADFSSIEARVLFWLADELEALETVALSDTDPKRHPDIYRVMAGEIAGKDPRQVTKKERQELGKTTVLGCGYGMGPDKYLKTCKGQGINFALSRAEANVKTYRKKFPGVPKLWRKLERAAIKAVGDGASFNVNGKLKVYTEPMPPSGLLENLIIELPSGRKLTYWEPELTPDFTPWGAPTYRLSYMGINSVSRKWERIDTYGAKLVENCDQAISRDLLAEAMLRVEESGYPIVMTVHDEAVCEIPEDFGSLSELETLMSMIPPWAIGCPVKAEGWIGKRYRK